MRISGLETENVIYQNNGVLQKQDSFSKNIQEQIMKAQERLHNLSENEEMSVDEKLKKRQEIQRQITELNNQLRQHQLEQRRESQETKSRSEEQGKKTKKDEAVSEKKENRLTQKCTQTLLLADSVIGQAQIKDNIRKKMNTKISNLETEISLEESRAVNGLTANVEAKKEELFEEEQKVMKVSTSLGETIGRVNDLFEEPNKNDRTESLEGKDEKKIGQSKEMQGKTTDLEKQSMQLDEEKIIKSSKQLSHKSIDIYL